MATNRTTATKRSTSRAKPATKRSTTKRAATKRSNSSSSNGRARTSTAASTAASRNGNGVAGTVKSAAGKAAGPAIAIGAAAAGVAGGILLKSRRRRKTVLGVPMPRSLGKGLPELDAKAMAKTVGHASKRFAQTSKNVSKDLERAGDQAERIGKILD